MPRSESSSLKDCFHRSKSSFLGHPFLLYSSKARDRPQEDHLRKHLPQEEKRLGWLGSKTIPWLLISSTQYKRITFKDRLIIIKRSLPCCPIGLIGNCLPKSYQTQASYSYCIHHDFTIFFSIIAILPPIAHCCTYKPTLH